MSRIGNKAIVLPAKVTITVNESDVVIKGPKGELRQSVPAGITVKQEDGKIVLTRPEGADGKPSQDRNHKALHGLARALLNNMVTGVSVGFRRTLLIEGVGYNGDVQGKNLVMSLGYSHKIVVEPPPNVSFAAENKGTTIHIDGIDKQVVGQVAANIRELRPPEPYLGKGVRYAEETIRRKAGKAGKTK
jgi:large subunit ribosomal protein L6